ncbi:MAG: hypothetical protein ABFD08_15590 [Syntrophomonas sp.]
MDKKQLKYHHLGIPSTETRTGETYLPEFKMYVQGFSTSQFGIEWMRFDDDCPLPDLVKTMPHIAFQVDDVEEAIKSEKILIEPNSPSPGVLVAFIEEDGVPIELIQINE